MFIGQVVVNPQWAEDYPRLALSTILKLLFLYHRLIFVRKLLGSNFSFSIDETEIIEEEFREIEEELQELESSRECSL